MGTRAQGRALWLPDVLRDAGLPIVVEPGWEHRGATPREWLCQVNHHTASYPPALEPSRGVVRDGRSDLPGPLANTLPRRDGTIRVMASGAANHPGVGYLPLRGGVSSGLKYVSLGHEIELSGIGEPFPPGGRQYESVARMNAAICAYLGLDPATTLFDHKFIARPQGRKIDVYPYDLAAARVRVARLMLGGAPTPPAPTNPEDLTVSQFATLQKSINASRPELLRHPVRTDELYLLDGAVLTPIPAKPTGGRLRYVTELVASGQAQMPPAGTGDIGQRIRKPNGVWLDDLIRAQPWFKG